MKLFRKKHSDNASSMTIFSLFLIICVLLFAGLIVDVTKNLYIKNQYQQAVQRATQTAIKDQNLTGGLKYEAMNTVIDEYAIQRGSAIDSAGSTLDGAAYRTGCEKAGPYPIIKVRFDTSRRVGATEIAMRSERFAKAPPISRDMQLQFNTHKYQVIDVEIIDVTDNMFLSMFGQPCSEIKVRASAITSSAYDDEGL